ncbi:hypothetical protein EsDP_00004674 [Epichloe bromicola]|uniref:Endo-beta-1,2-glucanase SGL domain-containing protein n=1 Tax=Epichloe bromicola TaxID=79588 RepID=A0ABQ0CSK1_9HYPO
MRSLAIAQLVAAFGLTATSALPPSPPLPHISREEQSRARAPKCRFAADWSQSDVLRDPSGFEWDLLFWEGNFHQNGVAYNTANGMTYDGTQLDWITGGKTKKHPFSAASKEALQIMLYTHAIAGSRGAARFLTPHDLAKAPGLAASIMKTKLQTYLRFNQTHPGFGGFLPWMTTSEDELSPTWDWKNRVPALDNGELIWAVYACIHALEQSRDSSFKSLAQDWQKWFDYVKTTAVTVFYRGNGRVCAVTKLRDQTRPPKDPRQGYACEGTSYLDDPYEGELFAHLLNAFGGLPKKDKDALWQAKRAKLVKREYNMGGYGPITVQEGYWFSSHEPWKVLELPYYDVDLVKRLYHNAERARTCNSVVTKVPGLFASVNNSTNVTTDEIIGYISPAGIPSIASQKEQYHDVITPYGAWPTILFDKAVGLAWWRNMVVAKKMQNPFGSTESTRVDGKLVSALVTWDSKVLTVVALLGGVGDFVRLKMKKDGIYGEFISITKREYGRVFKNLKGEVIPLCVPKARVPDAGLKDFTKCAA